MRYVITFIAATVMLYATDAFGRSGPFGPAWTWDTKSQVVYAMIGVACYVTVYASLLLHRSDDPR